MDDNQKFLRKLNQRTRFTQFLVWIALFFTAVGIAAGYKNWLRIHDKAKAGLAGLSEIREQIPDFASKKKLSKLQDEIAGRLSQHQEHIDGALIELRQIQDSTQHIADTVYTQVETLTIQQETAATVRQAPVVQNWSLSEVHFLLQTAVQMFTLKQDKAGAIKAMNLADQLLVKRGSIELLPLRKQISQDIALISQYAQPDIAMISGQINSLQTLLEPKELLVEEKSESVVSDATKENQADAPKVEDQESLVSRVKKTINEAVVVHKFDKLLQDEMDVESKKSLYQLLSLRLETLRLMLLQGRDKSYHEQIKRLKSLLEKYYSAKNYKPLIKQLDEMNSVNLTPEIPDITKSLTLLESLNL